MNVPFALLCWYRKYFSGWKVLISALHTARCIDVVLAYQIDKMITFLKIIFLSRFGDEVPDGYPYRAKAMFAFEEIDGVDVCFFGMHVQEYSSSCQMPNTRYIFFFVICFITFFLILLKILTNFSSLKVWGSVCGFN